MSGLRKYGQATLLSFFTSRQASQPSPDASQIQQVSTTPSAQSLPQPAVSNPISRETGALSEKGHSQSDLPKEAMAEISKSPAPTSSLTPPPSSDAIQNLLLREEEAAATAAQPSISSGTASGDRVIQNSDDESDNESDSSLEDLSTILQTRSAPRPPDPTPKDNDPTTPAHSHKFRGNNFHTSPLPSLPKYRFDLKSLAAQARKDDATNASLDRVKAIISSTDDDNRAVKKSKASHNADLLGKVVAETEHGDVDRVNRAIKRTEATLPEQRWNFFENETAASKQAPFPTKQIPSNWKSELKSSKSRFQSFTSGFAEDMVAIGRLLPDEIFLWILDEIPVESDDTLRYSYCGVLRESQTQVKQLITPNVIQQLFQRLGASSSATSVTGKIQPSQDPKNYQDRSWSNLCSVVKLLGKISKLLDSTARRHALSLLLRVSVDQMVLDNVDILDLLQQTIYRLCKAIPEDEWESLCQEVCLNIYECVDLATFRLNIVLCLPSLSPRTHELRRRLAMSFFFNDKHYSKQPSHTTMAISSFTTRLRSPLFKTTPQTDYREIGALVSLLDIALDDGRSPSLDLTDRSVARTYDADVDELATRVKDLIRGVGSTGASFISRIEAREIISIVGDRIVDTVRSRPRPLHTLFDGKAEKTEADLQSQRKRMEGFLGKKKKKEESASDDDESTQNSSLGNGAPQKKKIATNS